MNKKLVKKKKRKDICSDCGKKMSKEYEDCPFCGGGEVYFCKNCGCIYDIKTGESF